MASAVTMRKTDCACSPNSIIIKNNVIPKFYVNDENKLGLLLSGSRKIPFYESLVSINALCIRVSTACMQHKT